MNTLIGFDHPWVLLALPLVLLPWWQRPRESLLWSWGELLPPDRASDLLGGALRALASLAVLSIVVGAAGLHRPAYELEKVGQGAEIVMLVDRSRSMDQIFVAGANRNQQPTLLSYNVSRETVDKARPSKQQVARNLLAEFAAQRPDDRFAMLAFSTLPIRVLGFTQKPAAVQSAIAAGLLTTGSALNKPGNTWCGYEINKALSALPEQERFGFLGRSASRGFDPFAWANTQYKNWKLARARKKFEVYMRNQSRH